MYRGTERLGKITLFNVQCTCTMYNVQCTMYNVLCSMYNVQCTMYNVHVWRTGRTHCPLETIFAET